MTDPNVPPPERLVRQNPINVAPERKGGGLLAFLVGALVVAAGVMAWFLYTGERPAAPDRPEVNLNLNVPTPHLPEAPNLPDIPRPAEPPTVAAPAPAAASGLAEPRA
ncbi:MAG: hypothetical protein ACREEY_03530 [Brevundimonas sp.]